ncbi:MAG: DUF2461 domain-containing protein [Clostridiales bacterium]|nr:DUF2461 domain-containing protein [Clostridiales bacterium]
MKDKALMKNYNYTGIMPESIELLSLNRFNDSKSFYEEHKQQLKDGVTVPMRQIVLDLSDFMYEIEPLADMNPVYAVSRIRRDTRRTKSKMLYRENLWLMLRRNKFAYPFAPSFWFEFWPGGYMYGLGMWANRQAVLDYVRQKIAAEPARWLAAVEKAEKQGKMRYCTGEFFKKDRLADCPEELKKYINAKHFEFANSKKDLKKLESVAIVKEIEKAFGASADLYKFLAEAYDNAFSEGEIRPDDYKR